MTIKILKVIGLTLLWAMIVMGGASLQAYQKVQSLPRGNLNVLQQHLDQKLENAIRKRKLGCAALALITNGKIVSEKGYGIANIKRNVSVKPRQTLFLSASVSKAVTAWGVMKLVQDGKIGLDKPVLTYLKRWRFPGSNAYREKVTARHLLSHTAGIYDGWGYRGFALDDSIQTIEQSLTKTKDISFGEPRGVIITGEPGTGMAYSGAAYAILQLLIEEVTRQSFQAYMKEVVLQPLGMNASDFDLENVLHEGRANDLAEGYDTEIKPGPYRKYTAKAAVSLLTTAHDLALFGLAHMQNNPVLGRETLKQMQVPQPGTNGSWGLGETLFAKNNEGGYIVGHDGRTLPAWGAWVRINPGTGNGMVLLTSGGRGIVNQLAHDWVYWETGKVNFSAWIQAMQDNMVWMVVIIIAGAIVIVARILFPQQSRYTRAA